MLLKCFNGTLSVFQRCGQPTCGRGAAVVMSLAGATGTVRAATSLVAGEVEAVACAAVFPGTTGNILLKCSGEAGVVVESHTCLRSCAGDALVAAFTRGTEGNVSVLLRVPSSGLAHAGWVSWPCDMYVADTVGELGLLCVNGVVTSFGRCSTDVAQPCIAAAEIADDARGVSVAWLVLCILTWVSLIVGCLLGLHRWIKVLQKQRDVVPKEEASFAATDSQTDPQISVELTLGSQQPLDMVFCVDSSMSVGERDFARSATFLKHVIRELEMPPVRMGVLQFHHDLIEVATLTADQELLNERVDAMTFQPGETKLAPPLRFAGKLLETPGALVPEVGMDRRRKAIVVVTDGDPNDLAQAEHEADFLKERGVLLVFVQVGKLASSQVIRRLASSPAEQYVFQLHGYEDLPDCSTTVLRSVLEMSMWVRRAKCLVDSSCYQEVPDIDRVVGEEIIIPGWEATSNDLQGPDCWSWDPCPDKCWVDPGCVQWDHKHERRNRQELSPPGLPAILPLFQSPSKPAATQTERDKAVIATQTAERAVIATQTAEQAVIATQTAEQAVIATQTAKLPLSPSAATQTERKKPAMALTQTDPPIVQAGTQTDPIVRASLMPWRQAPLDLVVCVDSSASVLFRKGRAEDSLTGSNNMYIETGAFERAKQFVELLVSAVQMPEVQVGLIRFDDVGEMICPLTDNMGDFTARLRDMTPSVGETLFAPPLWQALDMLGSRSIHRPGWASSLKVAKAVVVITDGDPNDIEESTEAANALREHDSQLLFVKMAGKRSKHQRLQALAIAKSLPSADAAGRAAPPPRGIFEPAASRSGEGERADALYALVPEVLQQVLAVYRCVHEARFGLELEPYEEVAPGTLEERGGFEVVLSKGPYVDPRPMLWNPAAALGGEALPLQAAVVAAARPATFNWVREAQSLEEETQAPETPPAPEPEQFVHEEFPTYQDTAESSLELRRRLEQAEIDARQLRWDLRVGTLEQAQVSQLAATRSRRETTSEAAAEVGVQGVVLEVAEQGHSESSPWTLDDAQAATQAAKELIGRAKSAKKSDEQRVGLLREAGS